RYAAARHRSYEGDPGVDLKKLAEQVKGDEALAKLLAAEKPEAESRKGLERFCSVFPDVFFVADRSTNSTTLDATRNRPLTAGFHLMQGYFREDAPLCELVLTEPEKRELDALWFELDFIALAPMRQFKDYIFF